LIAVLSLWMISVGVFLGAVSIAGIPEPVTARKDPGRGSGLAALFWLASLTTRLRAARYGVSYRYLFMHPSGADLATGHAKGKVVVAMR
jgi:hypothetical protein